MLLAEFLDEVVLDFVVGFDGEIAPAHVVLPNGDDQLKVVLVEAPFELRKELEVVLGRFVQVLLRQSVDVWLFELDEGFGSFENLLVLVDDGGGDGGLGRRLFDFLSCRVCR